MYGNRFQPRSPPVRDGEEIDVRIESVGEKGDGVAKKDGFVLFVPNVKEGDEVRIRVTKVLRKVGFAEVIGQAQGPIVESNPQPSAKSQAEVDAREREQIAAQAESMESTEDFGEEPVEEEPADEPGQEDPKIDEEAMPVSEEPEEETPEEEDPVVPEPADDEQETSDEDEPDLETPEPVDEEEPSEDDEEKKE